MSLKRHSELQRTWLLHVGAEAIPATAALVLQSVDQRQVKGKEAQTFDFPEVSGQHFPEREELHFGKTKL